MDRQRWDRALIGVLVLWLAGGALARADDAPTTLARMKAEHERARDALNQRHEQAKDPAERRAIEAEVWTQVKATADRAFRWADVHPDDPESLDAVIWTIHGLANGYYPKYAPEIRRAYTVLTERGLTSDKVIPVCFSAEGCAIACPEARRFLETAAGRSPNRRVRGAATLGLGRTEALNAQLARRLGVPNLGKPLVDYWEKEDPAYLERLRTADIAASERRAEGYYDRVIDEFADLRMPSPYDPTPFGEVARGERDAITKLVPGKPAPGLEGDDVQDGKIRLSDFRGKVVVVAFWATWCGPCMAMVPHERAIVDRMKGRPFVLLGVNGDTERDKAAQVMRDQGMTWPSVWNGGSTEGIVASWDVRSWPTVYVIDVHGVIRYDRVGDAMLDQAVDRLVAEAESESKPAPQPPR